MTLKKFFKKPHNTTIRLKKKGGKKYYLLWWEQGFDCFVNKYLTSSDVPDKSQTSLICKRDFDTFIKMFTKHNYNIVEEVEFVFNTNNETE